MKTHLLAIMLGNYVPASFQFSYDAVPQFHLSHFAFDQSSIQIHVLLNHDILFSFCLYSNVVKRLSFSTKER